MKSKIYINSEFINDPNIDSSQFIVGCALSFIYGSGEQRVVISSETITYFIYGKDYKYKNKNTVKRAIEQLNENKYIKIIYSSGNIYEIEFIGINLYKYMRFTELSSKEYENIMSIDPANGILLKIYLFLKLHRNGSKYLLDKFRFKVVTTSIEQLFNMIDISYQTFEKYIKLLFENEIIYFIKYRTGDTTKEHVLYSLYEDRELCKGFAKYKGYIISWTPDDAIINEINGNQYYSANEKRRLKQIYNRMCAGHLEYDQDLIKEVKDYIYYCNELIVAGKYNGELLDTNVFSIYEKKT